MILVLNFVKNSLKTFSALKNLKIKEFDEICPENNVSNQLADLMGLIEKTINTTPPNVITNGDVINEKVDDDLDRLRNIKSLKQKEIINLQVGYARQTEISNLKVKFNNIHGYFIEVTNKNSQKLLEFSEKKFNLVQNTVNSSRFQTEELNKLTSEIQISESKAIDLEYKIYNDLCEKVRVMANKIGVFSEKIGYIDVISNFSYISKLNNYARPDIEEKIKIIEIEDGRHPIVEESLKHEASNFIPNNCSMSESRNLWLMTGPNMAGKSTFLRQVAITILLNQIGCFVPAKAANLSIFDKIFTRIGASDNLSKGMSTFMMEMVETSRIINNATENSFVILDELGRGTSTQDGLAIAQSVLEHIQKNIKCLTLFATHYKELSKLSENVSEIRLKTLQIKKWRNEIIFLYKVIDGVSEGSFGIHVAQLAGLKSSLINRSREILKTPDIKDEKNLQFGFHDLDDENNGSEKSEKIIKILKELNIDEISPKESLDILYTFKKNFID